MVCIVPSKLLVKVKGQAVPLQA